MSFSPPPGYPFAENAVDQVNKIYASEWNQFRGAVNDLIAAGLSGGLGGRFLPRMIDNRWYSPRSLHGRDESNMNLLPNDLYCVPVPVWSPCTIDRIACYVSTAAGTTNLLVLYADDGSIGPGTRIAYGNINPGTTGLKSVTVSYEVTTPCIVWVGIACDNNSTYYRSTQWDTVRQLGMLDSTLDYTGMIIKPSVGTTTPPNPFDGTDFWDGGGSAQAPELFIRVQT